MVLVQQHDLSSRYLHFGAREAKPDLAHKEKQNGDLFL